jgi:hypothetical protein
MDFLNENDIIQVFANEYISPKDKVLLIHSQNYEYILDFIGCEYYKVFIYEEPLPFEEPFDVIIDLNGNLDLKESVILKKINNKFYTVINGQLKIFGTIPLTK